jgi:energy-coupling factor transporter transmembrane protein EcfT
MAFSMAGLAAGVQMALRVLSIMVAVASFASSVSVSDLSQLLERAGLRGLGFALGVAVNMLPTIGRTLTVAYRALRLRGGLRRPWLNLRLLLVTVVANSLRHADDIVGSAEARAFSPERRSVVPLVWGAADVWAIGILVATTLALWLV